MTTCCPGLTPDKNAINHLQRMVLGNAQSSELSQEQTETRSQQMLPSWLGYRKNWEWPKECFTKQLLLGYYSNSWDSNPTVSGVNNSTTQRERERERERENRGVFKKVNIMKSMICRWTVYSHKNLCKIESMSACSKTCWTVYIIKLYIYKSIIWKSFLWSYSNLPVVFSHWLNW